jgi:hypothetical protein
MPAAHRQDIAKDSMDRRDGLGADAWLLQVNVDLHAPGWPSSPEAVALSSENFSSALLPVAAPPHKSFQGTINESTTISPDNLVETNMLKITCLFTTPD